jgi:hypothetical protein
VCEIVEYRVDGNMAEKYIPAIESDSTLEGVVRYTSRINLHIEDIITM